MMRLQVSVQAALRCTMILLGIGFIFTRLIVTSAIAQTIDWTGNGDGTTYASAANWDGVQIPDTAGENARFNVAATFDVLLGSGSTTTVGDLLVDDGTVTLDTVAGAIANATYNINDQLVLDGGTLIVADSASTFDVDLNVTNLVTFNDLSSTLRLSGGSLTASGGLDNSVGGTLDINNGTLTLDGGTSTLTAALATFLLDGSTASENPILEITNGAVAMVGTSGSPGSFTIGHAQRATLAIDGGAEVSNSFAIIGNGSVSDGTVTVSGSTSSWTSTSSLTVGNSGQGMLTLDGGAEVFSSSAIIGSFSSSDGTVVVSGTNGAGSASTWTSTSILRVGRFGDGQLTIDGGGKVANAAAIIGDGFSAGVREGTVIVSGTDGAGNASTWTNSASLTVGNFGKGTLTIEEGGQVSSVGGTLAFANNGSNFSEGAVMVSGTDGAGNASKWTNTGSLEVGRVGDATLVIDGGGQVSNTTAIIANSSLSTSAVTISGSDGIGNVSQWTNTAGLEVGRSGDATLVIHGGGQVSNTTAIIAGNSSSISSVTVSGTDGASNASTWTNTGEIRVGNFGSATLAINDGGLVSSTDGFVAFSVGALSNSTVTISGPGSRWDNSLDLYVGGNGTAAGGTGQVTVADQGLLNVGGTLKIWDAGTVTLNGGIVVLNSLAALEIEPTGTFAFNFGTLNFTNDLTIDAGDVLQTILSGSHTLATGQKLQVDGTTTLNQVLTLNGGTFSTDGLVNPQLLRHNTGTLQLTGASGLTLGATGAFGNSITVQNNQALSVTNTATVDAGGTLLVENGGTFDANLLANNGNMILAGFTATVGGSAVANSGVIRGEGIVSANVTNNAAGEIRASAGKTLTLTGASGANAGTINLQGGTFELSQALTNGPTGNIVGRGTLSVGGTGLTNAGDLALSNGQTDVFGDVANQTTGRVIVSGNADVTFWGDVSDSGALFNVSTGSSATFFGTAGFGISGGGDVFFEADITPGNSPGLETFGGNVHLGVLANLEIEIGGTTPGSEFDLLNIAGIANLDGTLDVSLLDGFLPVAGDTFEIITAADIVDTFAIEDLPNIGGLLWTVNYNTTSVVLEVVSPFTADFDGDGDVDGDDLAQWESDFSGPGSDADSDGDSDGNDFLAWQRQLGSGAGIVSAATVPEPSSSLLILAGLVAITCFRKPVAP